MTLAAERATANDLALMRNCIARMEETGDFDDYRRADIRFHIAVAQASGVPRLAALMTEVQAELSELIAHIAHPPAVLRHSNAEHARLADAVEAHDLGRSVRVVRRHLDGTEHILGGLLVQDPA
ncbi:MAG: FCD domain-containing protein [Actinomycetota bacterium]|nr:FCD domain-containing protein [Actinomycetota bacterium]